MALQIPEGVVLAGGWVNARSCGPRSQGEQAPWNYFFFKYLFEVNINQPIRSEVGFAFLLKFQGGHLDQELIKEILEVSLSKAHVFLKSGLGTSV